MLIYRGQGVGRYTQLELITRLTADCAALSVILATRQPNNFMFNSPNPHAIDACVYAHLSALFHPWDGNYLLTDKTYTAEIRAYLEFVQSKLLLERPAMSMR